MDTTTLPFAVHAACNNDAGPKEMKAWPFSGHEAGADEDDGAA